jgi:hypothetical protein
MRVAVMSPTYNERDNNPDGLISNSMRRVTGWGFERLLRR